MSKEDREGIGRKLIAALLAAIAARAALKLVEGVWKKGMKRDLPPEAPESSLAEKVAWVALGAAAVAAARELARGAVGSAKGRA